MVIGAPNPAHARDEPNMSAEDFNGALNGVVASTYVVSRIRVDVTVIEGGCATTTDIDATSLRAVSHI